MLEFLILHGAWTCFPFGVFLAWAVIRRRGITRWSAAALLGGVCVFAWARFVEPHMLQVHRETIILAGADDTSPTIRIALFSDTHLGLFPNAVPMRRIVDRINAEKIDAAFVAGDLILHPKPDQVGLLLAPLADLNPPLYAVLGNHDVGFPGWDLTNPLLAALEADHATIVQNRAVDTQLSGQRIIIAGASDLWQRRQDFGFSADLPEGVPVLLLTHNPDTAFAVPRDFDYALMLAGHTHGGQVRIPFLYKRFIPTRWAFDKGLHVFPSPAGNRLVYVTSGTGMSGLPLRLFMPPRIDVLTIHVPE